VQHDAACTADVKQNETLNRMKKSVAMVGNRVVAHHECDEGRSDEIAYGHGHDRSVADTFSHHAVDDVTKHIEWGTTTSKRLLLDFMPSMPPEVYSNSSERLDANQFSGDLNTQVASLRFPAQGSVPDTRRTSC